MSYIEAATGLLSFLGLMIVPVLIVVGILLILRGLVRFLKS